jgi:hypothetical protein
MKGSDPSWGTPPNAYELLKVEIEFFIQRYFDKHGHLPDNDTMQLEACRIIFAAETISSMPDHLQEVSWLRDLMTSSPELTERARFQPVRSSRESRHFPLRINAKDRLFDHCPLEAQLRDFATQRIAAGEALEDVQLHHEACQIIRRMEQESCTPSDVFANWIVKGIYSGTNWLLPFKQRAAISDAISTELPTDSAANQQLDLSWSTSPYKEPSISALGTASPSKQTHDFFNSLPTFSEEPLILPTMPDVTTPVDTYGRLRSLLPDDTNFYRIFDSDMRRWAASTLSPKNPNCHVPSDEEIQHQARWIMYDGDDPWNQTPADFPNWLSRFKKEVGIVSDAEAVNPDDLVI